MLKRISVGDLRLGMFIHKLEGSWLSHPFWKSKFVLSGEDDLIALRRSGVAFCWINTALGLDVEPALGDSLAGVAIAPPSSSSVSNAGAERAEEEAPPRGLAFSAVAGGSLDGPATLEEEFERASQVVSRSRQAVMQLFSEARLGKAVDAEHCLPLVGEVADSISRNPSAIISLARLKRKDDYTYMHSVAVCALMVSLGKQLNLDEQQIRVAGLAGLLHDIGKMAMPLDVLNKPGALSEPEYAIMRAHPERGFELLREGGAIPAPALDVALHHHERVDGTGYPHGLVGEAISQMARMGAVCDVYDAITSHRPYKEPWDPASSLARMAQWRGHFDDGIFKAFVRSVGIYPVGTLVRLESGRLAVVLDQNPGALTTPRVRVFYSSKTQLPVPTQVLDLSDLKSMDRIVQKEDPKKWGFTHLDELWQGIR